MQIRPITPLRHPLEDKRAAVPASKSVANRELVLSALAQGRSRLAFGPLDPGDDVHAMRAALAALGYELTDDGHGEVAVSGADDAMPARDATVDARDAGTVARFASAVAALGGGTVTVDGSARLRERPLAPLLAALRTLGASVDGQALPVRIRGPLDGGEVLVAGNESSQFASALLLVGARLPAGLRLRLAGAIVSAPFVEMTVAALAARGVRVERPSSREFVVAPQRIKARSLAIPGDVTAATYPAAAAAILGGAVTVTNADARRTAGGQGDARFFDLLAEMGCDVTRGHGAVGVRRRGELHGITANLRDCSDTFPTLAAAATQASEPTEISGVGHTRKQESDRVAAVAAGIEALGGRAVPFADGLRIEPRPLHEGVVDARGDHRVAMAFSILGLQVPGVAIDGAGSVAKTFPGFYEMLADLAR